jgi:hypothetical protein
VANANIKMSLTAIFRKLPFDGFVRQKKNIKANLVDSLHLQKSSGHFFGGKVVLMRM